MRNDLVVDVTPTTISTALTEDGRLMTLQREKRDASYAVGNLYLAKVKKLMPGLNAAFVNVGHEKDAFLHYLDLGSQFNSYAQYIKTVRGSRSKKAAPISKLKLQPDISKHGSISDILTQGQELIVQVAKEPISTKGPRLTTEITFTGRFLVLTPFNEKISISQKIKDQAEKKRLRSLIESIKPKNFGVIIRTSAENKRAAELNAELKVLIKCWEDAIAKLQYCDPPSLLYEEESRAVSEIRDIFNPDFESINVNDATIYEQIHNYVSLIAPERSDIVKLYTDDEPIFDHFNITRQIKSSFGKTVSFRSGAYIIIESTEALHVIDVNSGNRSKASTDQESNALNVNLLAADEIARQLRLRDLGGIIVIDFIDMSKAENRLELYKHMKELMAKDRARHNVLPLSKFGLMQITRQRVRPALDIVTEEKCPSCGGKGVVQPSLLFTDKLKDKIDYLVNSLNESNFIMYVHPFVDAYLKKGIFTEYMRWRREFGRKFKIKPDQSLNYLEYRVIDKNQNVLDLIEEKDTSSSTTGKKDSRSRNRSKEHSNE
ncbi:MAG: Rne/Rng family ribonuclease [Muribaculaceae bacterium]|nr:Rne/Rng family ribonuclease [Muribaculaceae bacterium]